VLIGVPFLIVVLGVGGIITNKYIQKNAAVSEERAAYNAAEADLDRTAAFIQAKLGPPDDTTEYKYCGYTSNPDEFERGDLYCSINNYLVYVIDSKAGANAATKEAEGFLRDGTPYYADQTIEANNILPATIASTDYDFRHLDCARTYTYDTMQSAALSVKFDAAGQTGNVLVIDLSCGSRPAKAAYYPIEQD